MTWNWLTGSPSSPVFMNGPVADALRNAIQVNQARDYFYKKYQGKDNLSDASVQNYKGKFGLPGLLGAGIDSIEQFIGTCRIDILFQMLIRYL